MAIFSFPILLLGALTTAQMSTVSLFLMDTDPQTLLASIISANPSSTEYLVGCPSTVPAESCGYNPPETVLHAGSVYAASVTALDEHFTMSYACTVFTSAGTSAVCTTSAGGQQANFPGVGTTTLQGSEISMFPVTVTAGVEKLGSGRATATSTSSKESTGATSSGMGTRTTSSATASQTAASGAERLGLKTGLIMFVAVAGGLLMI